jgi:hypothetical protein
MNMVPSNELAIKLEENRKNFLITHEFELLKSILSPHLVYVHSSGDVDSFDSYFEKLKQGTLVYQQLEYLEVQGFIFESTLVITGKMNARLKLGSQEKTVKSTYMATWVRNAQDQSQWLMCAHQGANRAV